MCRSDQPDIPAVNYLPGEAFISVSEYDSGIRNLVPHYDQMLEILSDQFPRETGKILEFGSGTGELTLRLLQKCPESEIICIDYSERMHRFMEEKLLQSGFSGRVRMLKKSMVSFGHDNDNQNSEALFDGCASSLAVHHLTREEKSGLLTRLYPMIRPGGLVWWADVVEPEDEALRAVYQAAGGQWLSEMNYHPEKTAGRRIADLFPSQAAQHFPESVASWRSLFMEAGFQRFDLLWKFFGLAIFGAIK